MGCHRHPYKGPNNETSLKCLHVYTVQYFENTACTSKNLSMVFLSIREKKLIKFQNIDLYIVRKLATRCLLKRY